MLRAFAERRREAEWMDDPHLDAHMHRHALRGLARINAASLTTAALWPPIARIAAARGGARLSLLDVACGGGEVAVALARRARRRGIALEVSGCDISETALRQAAARAATKGVPVRLFRFDALSDPIPAHYDVITTTLFLHHLADADIVTLLEKLAAHADHLVVGDLLRDPLGYALAWAGTRLLSGSRVVHVDGLRSVRAALDMAEARRLAAAAGLYGARFRRVWPRRFLMYWQRPGIAGPGRPDVV